MNIGTFRTGNVCVTSVSIVYLVIFGDKRLYALSFRSEETDWDFYIQYVFYQNAFSALRHFEFTEGNLHHFIVGIVVYFGLMISVILLDSEYIFANTAQEYAMSSKNSHS